MKRYKNGSPCRVICFDLDEMSRTELSSLIQVKFKEVLKNNNSLFDLGESSEATVNRDNILHQISSIFFGSQ